MRVEVETKTGAAVVIYTQLRGVLTKLTITENFEKGTMTVEARSGDKGAVKAVELVRKVGF